MPDTLRIAQHMAAAFDTPPVAEIHAHGRGLINHTYQVTSADGDDCRYILQRINEHVFARPDRVVDNTWMVLQHVQQRQEKAESSEIDFRLPQLVLARDGRAYARDEYGGVWRMLSFIEHTHSLASVSQPAHAEGVGHALGCFHALVADLDPARLFPVLEGLHDTPAYLRQLQQAIAAPRRRLRDDPETRYCQRFYQSRVGLAEHLARAQHDGTLKPRPIHGDPKLDNVLFDDLTGRAAALIDLDTVMSGLIVHDLGDCLRSVCNQAGEDSDSSEPARFDLDIAQVLLGGYSEAEDSGLTEADWRHLYEAIHIIPFELGMRFFADHLQGDRYFKTPEAGVNLQRAVRQFQLVEDIERRARQLQLLVRSCADAVR